MLTLTDVFLLLVAVKREPLVVLCNDNTSVCIHVLWMTVLPVAVLYVN